MCTRMFIAAMSTIAKLWKEPRCPSTDEWIKKMYVCTHTMDFYSATKTKQNKTKQKNLPFAMTWMELEGIMLSKRSQRKTTI